MFSNISFQYPIWFVGLCILLGLAYALFLYFKSDTFKDQSKFLNWILGFFRFLTVSLLSLLLLSPLLKSMVTETKKPIIVIAQDNSESIGTELKDSAQYKTQISQLIDGLEGEFDLIQYSFGSEVRQGIDYSFTDKASNLSSVLNEIYDVYSNQNLGAVILASDGIYNQGSNPIYAGTKLNVPVYTIALGDTTLKRDISVKKVFHNRIAYLGDKFSIQADISAQNCAGERTTLGVYKVDAGGTTKIKSEVINIKNNDFFVTKEIIIDANSAGVQRYRVTVNKVKGEVTTQNNSKDIFIDVLDARQRILLLANAPHPDLSAIKQTILKNKNYEVDIAYASKASTLNLAKYDFAILHQLPSTTNDISSVLSKLNSRKTPRLFVLGAQSNLPTFNKAQNFFNVKGNTSNANDVTGVTQSAFNLFTIDEKVPKALPKFAPMQAPFGEFKVTPDAQVLLNQKIGSVETKYPLLAFAEEQNTKIGVLAAEGIWRWRVFNYLQYNNHDIIDEILGKTVQYLSVKEDKRKFRVSVSKNIFNENEAIYFDAELYNESYELVNDPDARLTISNSEGKDFGFTFNKTAKAYALNAGYFPVGNYRYIAKITSNGKELTGSGKFSVQPIQLESFETTANHGILRLLSEQFGGSLIYPDQVVAIADSIKNKDGVKPVFYSTSKTRSVINLKWIFFILMGLLTVEWFFRKFYGGY